MPKLGEAEARQEEVRPSFEAEARSWRDRGDTESRPKRGEARPR
jgi:hypothetical protein